MWLKIAFVLAVATARITVSNPVFTWDTHYIDFEEKLLHEAEMEMMLGNDLVLTEKEMQANDFIMDLKYKILDEGYNNAQYYNFTKHFFKYKDDVKELPLFKIIKDMPKGAVLHIHDTGIMDPDYVVALTYWDNLFVCRAGDDIQFLFSKTTPDSQCATGWKLMSESRRESCNVKLFDKELRKHFTIVIENPEVEYADINRLWTKFQNVFTVTTPLLTYKPIWEQYFYDAMKTFRDDNVMYVEMRSVLPTLYDLNGQTYDAFVAAKCLMDSTNRFVADYPDFIGSKLIYAPLRIGNSDTIKEYIATAEKLKKTMPDFFAGFDLVGQEDLNPLRVFLPELAKASGEIDFFFHVGETSWNGFPVDENLYDAIALGAKRLGHAFPLLKHPLLFNIVKSEGIPIEVNPISSTIGGNTDLRNHPLATFLAEGVAVVISSDDPGVWESDPLSYDFYATFVGASSRHADLRLLKKLALNSLNFSALSNKDDVIGWFLDRWDAFIDLLIERGEEDYYS